jgi:hypothetical protein
MFPQIKKINRSKERVTCTWNQGKQNKNSTLVTCHRIQGWSSAPVSKLKEQYCIQSVKYPAVSSGVFDSCGSRQMNMRACPLGLLPAEIKKEKADNVKTYGSQILQPPPI